MGRAYPRLTHSLVESILQKRFDGRFHSLSDLPDPYSFKDMRRAVDRIVTAIRKREKIVVVGDYDVDGITATSVMRLFFRAMDYDIDWIVPNRFRDGYGLSPTLFSRISHADLVVTVDNGISAVDAAKMCADADIDLIITDHHIVPPKIPDAYAIIDQKQRDCDFPYEEVCGAQIAWYLCAALNRELGKRIDMKSMLDIVSLAVIADIMPLKHINRAMVTTGLKLLEKSQRAFVRAYREFSGKDRFTAEDIAFGLAPLLNSAGRMEDASIACDFICSGNIYEARSILSQLVRMNEERKKIERDIVSQALERVDMEKRVHIVTGEGWNEGVLGIVAARVARHCEAPTVVLTRKGDIYKGSGRSFGNCDLFGLIDGSRDILEKFGGHSAAVGLSLRADKMEMFKESVENDAVRMCDSDGYEDPAILGILDFEYIDFSLCELIDRYEPFGHENPRPLFICENVEIVSVTQMGDSGDHLRLVVRQGRYHLTALRFRVEDRERDIYRAGEKVDILFKISINEFRGEKSVRLLLEKVIPLPYGRG